MKYLLVFLVVFISDILWVLYVRRVADRSAIKAALNAVIMYIFAATAVISYTTDKMLLIPACVGAFIGTYIGVKYIK